MSAGAEKERAIQEVKNHFVEKKSSESLSTSKSPSQKESRAPTRPETNHATSSLSTTKPPSRTNAKLSDSRPHSKNMKTDKDLDAPEDAQPSPRTRGRVRRAAQANSLALADCKDQDTPPASTPILAATSPALVRRDSMLEFSVPANPPTPLAKMRTSSPGTSSQKVPIRKPAPFAKKQPRNPTLKQTEDVTAEERGTLERSAVTYAQESVLRNVKPSRPGEFEEEELVVGMRWVVI